MNKIVRRTALILFFAASVCMGNAQTPVNEPVFSAFSPVVITGMESSSSTNLLHGFNNNQIINPAISLSPLSDDMDDMSNWKAGPFSDPLMSIGMIGWFAGYGSFLAGGAIAAADIDLSLALLLGHVGAGVSVLSSILINFGVGTVQSKYNNAGAEIDDDSGFMSWTFTFASLGFAAAGIGMAIASDDLELPAIISSGVSLIIGAVNFFVFQRNWLKKINTSIIHIDL